MSEPPLSVHLALSRQQRELHIALTKLHSLDIDIPLRNWKIQSFFASILQATSAWWHRSE